MKSRQALIALVGALLVPGCVVESRFELAPESRLPRWFFKSIEEAGHHRVTLVYYTQGTRATLVLSDSGGTPVAEVEADVRPSRALDSDDPPTGPLPYPRYRIATAQGITEIIEHRRMEPVFYISDDPAVRRRLGLAAQ